MGVAVSGFLRMAVGFCIGLCAPTFMVGSFTATLLSAVWGVKIAAIFLYIQATNAHNVFRDAFSKRAKN